jgi:tRNA pseudouridine32 synthase/23S rRNA pseudouridine746 synthase
MEYQPPPFCEPDYLYVDDYLLAVDKPAGLLSVPGRGEDKQDCLIARVQRTYPEALTAHRLDMGTSGLIICARGCEMQRRLFEIFRERQTEKRYVAVVAGRLEKPEGEIDLPLICDWPNRPRQKVDFEVGKHSLTRYRLLTYDPASNTSRVQLEPVTGRSHQLRVHMASLGHPILGDELYAGEHATAAPRLLLHAEFLRLPHPSTEGFVELHCLAPF